VSARELVPPIAGSPLALREQDASAGIVVEDASADSLLYVASGSGELELDGERHALGEGAAALVLAGERARLTGDGLLVLHATVGPEADRHAPLGRREVVSTPDAAEQATGSRSFRLYFGPHNGSTRATLFAGLIPPGKAPWHFHLYDEIVWVPAGPGRLWSGDSATELGPGSAFRLRPREVHIVENAGEEEMAVIGVFTPAGSPSAAYLTPDVAAAYRFSG
jgi:quercetin dioxygenase-like cupin family protein